MDPNDNIRIRDNLEDALETELDLSGLISYHKEYPDAPNPALQLDNDIGAIGVPLSTRDAQAIKSKAIQAPFGKGEHTLVDKSVRDTWEMDAKSVTFTNPGWETFMTRVVADVCKSLGVNLVASAPRCELYKLLLYETGSHFLPHVDTEKVDGMFATIVVVLPSEFTGGQAHLTHGSISEVYDCSPRSRYQTSVMAWYTDVSHEIKPIESGYRLALSYNLIHSINMLRPTLSNNFSFRNQVSTVLKQWKEAGDKGPDKLIYLLSHKYSQANLKGSALKGEDDTKISLLSSICKELGFQLGLASVVCHLSGSADNDRYRRRGYGWDDYSDDDYYDNPNIDFAEVEEREMSIAHFVDMDGNLISESLEVDEELETIPADLSEMVEEGPHDDQDYEGYQGNCGPTLERWYRRSILIIWPTTSDYKVRYGGEEGFLSACRTLSETKTSGTGKEERDLLDFVLSGRKSYTFAEEIVTRAVCSVALTWNDCDLWNRAIEEGCLEKGLAVTEDSNVMGALQLFGLTRIQKSLELLLQNTQTNARRFGFLDMIKTSVNVEELGPGDEDLLSWIQAQMHLCLQTMKKPDKSEISLLTSLIAIYGIVTFRDSILPQIQNHLSSAFLSKLAISISKETQILASDDKTELISDLVKAAISKLKLRQSKPTAQQAGYPYPYNHAPRPKMQGDLNLYTAKKYIQICISLHLVHHLGELFDKAADVTGIPEATVQTRLKDFMLPLMTFMESVKLPDGIQVNQVPRMVDFAKTATKLYVASLSRTGSSMSSLDGRNFMSTVIAGGGWDLLKSSLLPKVDSFSISTDGLLGIVAAIHAHKDKLQEAPNLQDVIISLMNKCVTNANCVKADDISIILKACIEVQAFPSITLYLNRIAHASNLRQDYIKNTLIPLIPRLRELGSKYSMLDTFASTFQFIIAAWMSKCLGPKPVDDGSTAAANVSRRWSCSCYECASVKKFLTQPPVVGHPSLVLSRIGAPKRKHIERELTSCYAREISTWEMITGSPQGLRITLLPSRYEPAIWRKDQALGIEYLKQISTNEEELQRLLGPNYAKIVNTLRGTTHAQNAPQVAGSSTQVNITTPVMTGNSMTAPSTDGGPPAKRRKTVANAGDVIDLTED